MINNNWGNMKMIRNMMIGMIGYLYETGVIINDIVSEENDIIIYCELPENSYSYDEMKENADSFLKRVKEKTQGIFDYMHLKNNIRIKYKIIKGYNVTKDMRKKLHNDNLNNIYKYADTICYFL